MAGGGKGGRSQTVSGQTIDPVLQSFRDSFLSRSQGVANAVPTEDLLRQAGALSLTSEGLRDFISPNLPFEQELAKRGVGDEATRLGAFGGSRHGIAEGEASAAVTRNAINDAAQRLQMERLFKQQLGLGALGQFGQGISGSPFSTTQQQTFFSNPFASALGGGLAGGAISPLGAGLGAAGGLLSGLFG